MKTVPTFALVMGVIDSVLGGSGSDALRGIFRLCRIDELLSPKGIANDVGEGA